MQEPTEESYNEYLQQEIALFERRSASERAALEEAISGVVVSRLLDVGCGAGEEMLPFAQMTNASCVGLDISPHVGRVGRQLFQRAGCGDQIQFVRGKGECLPFDDGSFDLVICRLALPYMDNREAIAEMSRVLCSGGRLFLKIHAPLFYLAMLRARIPTFDLKQCAYPFICIAGSAWYWMTGRQLRSGFWKGKEVFQTQGKLFAELRRNDLWIHQETPGSNRQTPSYLIIKKNSGS